MTRVRARLPKTTKIIEDGVEAKLYLGAQIYISHQGEVMADAGIGEARAGVPMTEQTLMLWLSSSKPLTAVAIAQLHERGKFDFHDKVSSIIPEFSPHGKEAITIRQLLTHTGGFRSADKIPEILTWQETLEQICEAPIEPGWVPGQKAGYHLSSSWFVLGEIVRRLSGQSFDEYARNEIFLPLGMRDSWFQLPPERYQAYGERVGQMHVAAGSELKPHPALETETAASACRPGSSGRGPIRELGFFYEMLLNGGRTNASQLLRPDTIKELTSSQRVGMFDHTFQHIMDWGLGFIVDSKRYGVETVPYGYGRFSSEAAFGHSGSQSSTAFADPEHRLVVAWVLNGMPGERRHQQRAREINSAIYEDLGLT